jgi:Fe-S cluster biogenesis protein NfuA
MSEPASEGASTASDRERIEDVLDSIRPAIRQDGGDIELVDFEEEEGRVRVRMVGACYACPMSMMTLKAGVEQRLRMEVPGVRTVEAI